MNVCFENARSLSEGIAILAEDLGYTVVEGAADVTVTVTEVPEQVLSVSLHGSEATVTYGGGRVRFFRGLARLVQWLKDGEADRTLTETPLFTTNGSMVDMSRNAVMNVPTVKLMLRKMALMGMNCFMLYTEDTYEVENRPYFGHMRGRYTGQEIRELDAYAIKLGIELIPCIQTLGHLATHIRWGCAGAYRDTASTLRAAHRHTWTAYCKSFGWEVHDIRYGGLVARFETVKASLLAYLAGEIPSIEELEEERLFYRGNQEDASYDGAWEGYLRLATTGILN